MIRKRMRRYPQQRPYSSRKKRKNWFSLLLFLGVISLFFWAVFQFFSLLFSNVQVENTTAELEILKGRVDFRLSSEESDWVPAFSQQTFVEGDAVKTAKNSKAKLSFLDQNTFFIDQDSILKIKALSKKSSGEKNVEFEIENGQVWGKVMESDFSGVPSNLVINTPRVSLLTKGIIFNIISTSEEDIVRLTQGTAQVEILDDNGLVIKTLSIGMGQELVVNDQNIQKIMQGDSVIQVIDSKFLTSDWHIENLSVFDPVTAESLKTQKEATKEMTTKEEEKSAELVGNPNIETPVILTPEDGTTAPAETELVKIEGVAPLEAFQIQVNGYALSKFQPGDRKWTYFASTKLGTLKPGENIYEIVTVTREGDKSFPAKITINYEGVEAPVVSALPIILDSKESQLETKDQSVSVEEVKTPEDTVGFEKPKVKVPEIFLENPDAVYQTSSAIVTFSGTVPTGTVKVKINNFELKKFKLGDIEFSYIANANYGNMKEGENIFTIVAFGQNGEQSHSQIKILYTPIKLEN